MFSCVHFLLIALLIIPSSRVAVGMITSTSNLNIDKCIFIKFENA